jgi:hypothetical protein
MPPPPSVFALCAPGGGLPQIARAPEGARAQGEDGVMRRWLRSRPTGVSVFANRPAGMPDHIVAVATTLDAAAGLSVWTGYAGCAPRERPACRHLWGCAPLPAKACDVG